MTIRSRATRSRRRFLAELGLGAAAGAALPFVPFLESEARAVSTPARRLVLFVTGNGTQRESFVPAGGEPSRILEPLRRHWARTTVCSAGIEQRVFVSGGAGRDHVRSHPQLLTGRRIDEDRATAATGISVDQYIANAIGGDTPFRTLVLGGFGRAGAYSFTGPNAPVNAERSPETALARTFAGVASAESGPSLRDQQRVRIADLARRHLGDVGRRVGVLDRRRIEAHVAGLDELERRIDTLASITCAEPELAGPMGNEHNSDLQAEILASAMACDLTRVGMLVLGNSGNVGESFPFLGITEDAHEIAHATRGTSSRGDARAKEQHTQINTWNCEKLAVLLDKLAERTDAEGRPLLDTTVVMWIGPLASGSHEVADMPVVFGSGGGAIREGEVLDLGDRTTNDLLLTLCHAFGIEDETFGEADFCSGPITELLRP